MKNSTKENAPTKYKVRANRYDNLYVYSGGRRLTVGWIGSSFVDDTIKLLTEKKHTEICINDSGIWLPLQAFDTWKKLLEMSGHSQFLILAR